MVERVMGAWGGGRPWGRSSAGSRGVDNYRTVWGAVGYGDPPGYLWVAWGSSEVGAVSAGAAQDLDFGQQR